MSEITVKELAGSHETEVNGTGMYALFLKIEGDGAPEKIRVLAKTDNKWQPGSKAVLEVAGGGYEGPDGEKDWTYCRLKTPEGAKGGKFSRGGSSSGGKFSKPSGSTSTSTGPAPMPTVTYSEASAAYDDFAQEAAISVSGNIEALLGNFSAEAKPTPDAILAAAVRLTTAKANSLFAAYIKSFRVAYQSKSE